MCIEFTCFSCFHTFNDHCKDKPADSKPVVDVTTTTSDNEFQPPTDQAPITVISAQDLLNKPGICSDRTLTSVPKNCDTCIRIKGAIERLNHLVFQAPFLATDGLAGVEKLAVWDKNDLEQMLCGRKKGWEDKAESREERHKVQERIEKMGLDGAVDGRIEHQGFDMSVTPLEKRGSYEEADGELW